MKPGIYPDIPITDYHSMARVGHTYLTRLDRCPAAARTEMEDTPAFRFGRACHAWVLEQKQDYAVAPNVDKRTKEGKAVYAAFELEALGQDIITQDEHMAILAIRDSVMSHPVAGPLIAGGGVAEQTVLWDDKSGVPCKARPDFITRNELVLDLKTTANADKYAFESWVRKSYALQAAFYLDGLAAIGRKCDNFIFIVAEKEPPYRVEVYDLSDDYLLWGRSEYERLLSLELQCRREKHYPHYQSAGIRTIYKPEYL